MRKRKSAVEKALDVIGKAIAKDAVYRETWVANIAMSFMDNWEWCRARNGGKRVLSRKDRHEVANLAANHFIWLVWERHTRKRIEKGVAK
jgi:hypothetical protein